MDVESYVKAMTDITEKTPISFSELREQAIKDNNNVEPSILKKEDGNTIKPKYIEDNSILYKSSSYLKDLIGEGN